MLSVDKGFLIKKFMEDRERLGTVTYTTSKSIFDKDIYGSLQSHKETQSVEESIQLIQERGDTTKVSLNVVTDVRDDKEKGEEDKEDSKKESDNIYEHELKSILLTDLMSKRDKDDEDQKYLKTIKVSQESLEPETGKKKNRKKDKGKNKD